MKHVLITGGSRGIGAAAVRLLAARGDRVWFLYEKNDAAAAAIARETGAEPIRCDEDACRALGVEVLRRPLAAVGSGFVRHDSGHLARELIQIYAQRGMRIAGN